MLAALTAGAALGFLVHNFHPASVFMGDAGANLLGYLLGVVAVVGTLKTNAVVALLVPLVILAVPVLDTGFVIAKRLKYRRKPWSADANHFHHRMARIGFSQRKTVAYLYAWTTLLAAVAVGMRLLPIHRHNHYSDGWFAVLVVLAAGGARVQRLSRDRASDLQVPGPAPARAGAIADRHAAGRARRRHTGADARPRLRLGRGHPARRHADACRMTGG